MQKKVLFDVKENLENVYHGGLVNVSSGLRVLSECLFSVGSDSDNNKGYMGVDCSILCDMLLKEALDVMTQVESMTYKIVRSIDDDTSA